MIKSACSPLTSVLTSPKPMQPQKHCSLTHIFGKYVVSRFVLPSSSNTCRKDCVTKAILKDLTDITLKDEISSNYNVASAKQIIIKTTDGVSLDGIEVLSKEQETTRVEDQKWSIVALPNLTLWQQICHLLLIPFTNFTGINLLCVNYRMTGNSEAKRPDSFHEICLDVDGAVQELLKRGVKSQNILLHGISLGGATALHVAYHYKQQNHPLECVIQNTFNKAQDVVPEALNRIKQSLYKARLKRIESQESDKTGIADRAIISLRDAFFSLPHLALRVRFLALCFLGNLVRCRGHALKENFINLVKTTIFDIILTLSGFISFFLSPFTNKLNKFNASLNQYFLKTSISLEFITSSKCEWLARKMIACSGWDPDNETIIHYTKKGNIFYTPTDTYIKEEASLATPFKKTNYPDLQITALPEIDDYKRRLDHSDIAGNFEAPYQTPRSSTFQDVDRRFSEIINAFKAC